MPLVTMRQLLDAAAGGSGVAAFNVNKAMRARYADGIRAAA